MIDSGEVETSAKGPFQDPLNTPTDYLGTAINVFRKGDFFGKRSLIAGQPRAASIRATEKTRCFTFKIDDLPASTVLSCKLVLRLTDFLRLMKSVVCIASAASGISACQSTLEDFTSHKDT